MAPTPRRHGLDKDLFQWSDSFSIGLQEVDEQHKVLVGLLNELHEAIVRVACKPRR